VGTPEFAPGLSAEVTVMLRDGLQEARLQLNPAEMGPITVQIQIEGDNARINLSAEQAPTRDALEQALPTLASTLRDNGLTLTGGGVFEQPRPPREDSPPPSVSNARGSDDAGSAVIAGVSGGARQLAPRGVVDLYA
jgi:flagellar hook-length control protein FliK